MNFTDDEPIICDMCNDIISPGNGYYKFDDCNYCSNKCLGFAMIEKHYDEVTECYIMTADDKIDEYGDMMSHQFMELSVCGTDKR